MSISSRATSAPVGVTAVNVLPHSDARKSVLFMGGNAGRITLSHDPAVTLDNGLTIVQGSGPLLLLYDEVGSAVCQAWYAISAAAGNTLGIIEGVEG